jgi:ankyrin repeat protein
MIPTLIGNSSACRYRPSPIVGSTYLVLPVLIVLACGARAFGGDIHDAAASGDLAKVQALLKDNPSLVFSKDDDGLTPLHWAAVMGHKDVAELLVADKADVNARDDDRLTPLHMTAGLPDQAGGGYKEVAELLLAHNAEVGAKDHEGKTPLHRVADNGKTEVAELLLAKGADVNALDDYGNTPLHLAAVHGQPDMVVLLLAHHAKVNLEKTDGTSAYNAQTPLHLAAEGGYREIVELLLANGAVVDAKDEGGKTPLLWAAEMGHKDVAELLLAKGADLGTKDADGATPLHWAARNGNKDVTQWLLSHKAAVDARDKTGKTPLHWAAIEPGGPFGPLPERIRAKRGAAELLLAKGANVNAKDNAGATPLQLAMAHDYKELAELLSQHNVRVTASAVAPAVGQKQRRSTRTPPSPVPPEMQDLLNSVIIRYAENATRFGVPLWGGGLKGRIRGVVGESNAGRSNLTAALENEESVCTDDTELVFGDHILEILPGSYLQCSFSAPVSLTVRFEYGAFTLRGDRIEIRAGTLAYIATPSLPAVPCVFRDGQWMKPDGDSEFRIVDLDVSEFAGFLILINKEKDALRNMKLEIISDTGHHYLLRAPGIGPSPSLPVYLDLSKFRDGAGAAFDSKMARLLLYCEVNGELGRTGWDWKGHSQPPSSPPVTAKPPATAPVKWLAAGGTAVAITGDIELAPDKITIRNKDYPLTLVREIDARHMKDVAKIMSDQPIAARLYRTKIPKDEKFNSFGNTACDDADANWVLVDNAKDPYTGKPELGLAFFSGESEPDLDYKVVSTKVGLLCGTFGYSQ